MVNRGKGFHENFERRKCFTLALTLHPYIFQQYSPHEILSFDDKMPLSLVSRRTSMKSISFDSTFNRCVIETQEIS